MTAVSRVSSAMILAAGGGTRLRPLTLDTPKVLLPVGGAPLMHHTLAWLRSHGISQAAVNLHHLGEEIRDFVGDGSRFGMEIVYSEERKLLGTAGAVKRMADWFSETFAVIYGDVLTDMDLGAMIQFHTEVGAKATIAVQELEDIKGKGVVHVDGDGRLISFLEKPALGYCPGCLASAGIYLLEPEILQHIKSGFSDFGIDVLPRLLELRVPVYGWRLRPREYLIDIGTPEAYRQANEGMAKGQIRVEPSCVPR